MIKLVFGFLGFVLAIGVFVFLGNYFNSLYATAPLGSIKESLYKTIAIMSTIMLGFLIWIRYNMAHGSRCWCFMVSILDT